MKKIILSLLGFATVLSLNPKTHKTSAETNEVTYLDNAYQICEIQNSLTNLFLGNSIYNSSNGSIRLINSIKINNPQSKKLTMYFKFKEDISNLHSDTNGSFTFLLKDSNRRQLDFAEEIQSFQNIKESMERDDKVKVYIQSSEFFIEIDTSAYGETLTFCGDEHSQFYDAFVINLGNQNLTIEKFMLAETSYSSFKYSKPTIGIGSNSEQVYHNNDTIKYTINYDNRLSLEEIKQDIIAYDYYDNRQITPSIELDEYTSAVNENKLGDFSVKLKATDQSNNSTILNLNLRIEDTTKPIYTVEKNIEIHYTDLPANNLLDLTKYIYAEDNHDGLISLEESYQNYSVKMFDTETKEFTFTDISGNSVKENVTITITDHVNPIITGEESISIYQYEYADVNSLLNLYTFTDDGSGIKNTYVESNITDFSKSVEYDLTFYAEDNCSNVATKSVKLTIKDGVGPVFFVNLTSLNVTNESLMTAEEVIDTLIQKGSIAPIKYSKCSYITKTYEENYSKIGEYDTQIVCYDEEGNTDYYLVKINVNKLKSSNFFTRFYSSMVHFFTSLFNDIKDFFIKIFNFFKK